MYTELHSNGAIRRHLLGAKYLLTPTSEIFGRKNSVSMKWGLLNQESSERMKKELGINLESVMTSYSYYAFPQCIMTAEDKIGSRVVEFEVIDPVCSDWKCVGNITCADGKNLWRVISEDKYRRECNGCIYREMNPEDYICIRVDFQQYSEPWGAVNLFITDNADDILLGDNEYRCRFGHFVYDGVSLYIDGEWQSLPKKKLQTPYQLVLSRQGKQIGVYAGEEQAECLAVKKIRVEEKRKLYIGVQVRHEENSYYPWLFSNFIQLNGNVYNQDRKLEFHYGLSKHWDYNILHYFFDTNRYTAGDILKMGGIKYVKNCLDEGKYMETKLDQYYIEEREEYHSFHHLHQNLVYGYDDRKKILSVAGYDKSGKLVKTAIRYRDFRQSLNCNKDILFQVITYQQDGYHFRFNGNYVKGMIREYLDGINSSEKMQHIVPRMKRSYGMKIYEDLMSDRGIEVLISDRRVAHVLWEHKKCMVERIEYLVEIGILEENTGQDLAGEMQCICELVYDMKQILLKYQMRPDKKDDEKIRKYLQQICGRERECLERLIENWKEEI